MTPTADPGDDAARRRVPSGAHLRRILPHARRDAARAFTADEWLPRAALHEGFGSARRCRDPTRRRRRTG